MYQRINIPILDGVMLRLRIKCAKKPLVVAFGFSRCMACKNLIQLLDTFRESDKIDVAFSDVMQHQDIKSDYEIDHFPTTIIFSGGQEVARKHGSTSGENFLKFLQSNNIS
jgi:thioredoxin-like negative regulator of GroEL